MSPPRSSVDGIRAGRGPQIGNVQSLRRRSICGARRFLNRVFGARSDRGDAVVTESFAFASGALMDMHHGPPFLNSVIPSPMLDIDASAFGMTSLSSERPLSSETPISEVVETSVLDVVGIRVAELDVSMSTAFASGSRAPLHDAPAASSSQLPLVPAAPRRRLRSPPPGYPRTSGGSISDDDSLVQASETAVARGRRFWRRTSEPRRRYGFSPPPRPRSLVQRFYDWLSRRGGSLRAACQRRSPPGKSTLRPCRLLEGARRRNRRDCRVRFELPYTPPSAVQPSEGLIASSFSRGEWDCWVRRVVSNLDVPIQHITGDNAPEPQSAIIEEAGTLASYLGEPETETDNRSMVSWYNKDSVDRYYTALEEGVLEGEVPERVEVPVEEEQEDFYSIDVLFGDELDPDPQDIPIVVNPGEGFGVLGLSDDEMPRYVSVGTQTDVSEVLPLDTDTSRGDSLSSEGRLESELPPELLAFQHQNKD